MNSSIGLIGSGPVCEVRIFDAGGKAMRWYRTVRCESEFNPKSQLVLQRAVNDLLRRTEPSVRICIELDVEMRTQRLSRNSTTGRLSRKSRPDRVPTLLSVQTARV